MYHCSGDESDFEAAHESKECVLFRAEKMDQQAFFVDCPGWSTTPANQPWKWICKEVTSSYAFAEHVMDDEGRLIERDEGI